MKPHKCYACGKEVKTFMKEKRKAYFVKVWQHIPPCLSLEIQRYYTRKLLESIPFYTEIIRKLSARGE